MGRAGQEGSFLDAAPTLGNVWANSVKSIWSWFIHSDKPCPDAFQSIHSDAYNDPGERKPVHTYIKEQRDAFSSMKE